MPIAQFSRAEFQLRKDAVLAFQEAGFEMDDQDAPKCLTFWDEVEWDKVADSKVILVDHNKMSPEVEVHAHEAPLFVYHAPPPPKSSPHPPQFSPHRGSNSELG